MLLNKVMRIFFHSTRMNLTDYTRDIEVNDKWMECFLKMLEISDPKFEIKNDDVVMPEKVSKEAFWAVKKNVLGILKKYSGKYAIAKNESPENRDFSNHFAKTWGTKFSNMALQIIGVYNKGVFVPKGVLSSCCVYLNQIVRSKVVKDELKPHYEDIMFGQIFPLLYFRKEDEERYNENPVEYFRQNEDSSMQYSLPVEANAILIRYSKHKDSENKMYIYKILLFINQFLSTGKNPRNDQEL